MDNKLQIQNSIDYIERHLCKSINLDEIAKQSHFSKFHFHRLFRKTVGTSVMEHVRKRRLSAAAQDLAGTNMRITDIAFKYQFNSEESFSRAFKRLYGRSPRDYRNIALKPAGHGDARKIVKPASSRATVCLAA